MSERPTPKYRDTPGGQVAWSIVIGTVAHGSGVENNIRRARKAATHELRMHPRGCWCSENRKN